ncbi:2-keto-4-pentenoate hydratase [Neoroseomonas rubea]|uniref:2-keto-4-pentenoate hydratase n=1 Tax=Neoroseomonas rubea TaxID=2748666 RepID=UPI001E2FF722|nr:hypothetical protein [Roseomonas rubea]
MRRMLIAAALLALPTAAQAACPEEAAVERLAAALVANTRSPALTGMTSMADGQCGQDRLVAILSREWGRPVGYKVGLTNPAAQQRFGLGHPITGTIFESTIRLRDGAEVPARFGAVPTVEADLMVRIRDEGINGAGRDRVAILRHIDQVIPFIEMPDLALSGGMDGPNLLAINVGARLGVLGTPIAPEATEAFAARLAEMTVVLANDQRELARAPGTALLGHPLDVVPWLVEDLAKRGLRLRAGDYVSLGGFSPALPTEAGRTYTVRYEGLMAQPVTVSVRTR